MGRRISIRQLIGLLLVVAVVAAGLLFRVTSLQLDNASERRDAQVQSAEDLALGDEVSSSASDLGRLAHLYVETGDERFKRYHQEILDIRAGEAPRPEDYDSDFWESVVAEGKGKVEYGSAAALIELARAEGLTPEELRRLDVAIGTSDDLARDERKAMKALASEGKDASGQLATDAYNDRRLEIESAVDDFNSTVNGRTQAQIASLEDRRDELLIARGVILAALGLVVAAALFVTARWIATPLRRLTAVTRRIATGEYGERTKAGGVSELAQLADDFNEMADAIQGDIARRKQAELAAEEADQAKSDFLAVMSHELRTPMVGVSGTLDVLARTEMSPEQRELVGISQRSAGSMLEIIGEILDMSKIEAGKLTVAPATVSLRNVLEDVVTDYRQAASEGGLVLSLEVDQGIAAAHMLDRDRLRQVLANLLSNAVKFTSSGRIVVVARALDGDGDDAGPPKPGSRQMVEIAVADTGIGIPEQAQAKLFEPFTQVDAGATRRVGGTGLGLVISREIAEMMGGNVSLESTPGEGTTVRVKLELEVGDPDEIAVAPPPGAEPDVLDRELPRSAEEAEAEGSLVLLVEDHPVNRRVLCTQLEAIGFLSDTASDGVEGLERFRGRDYALVLADVHMPNMDGYELARRIRGAEAERGSARLPMIAVTASALHDELDRCREAGMDDLITKPTTIVVLAERLRHFLPDLPWITAAPPVGGPPTGDGPEGDDGHGAFPPEEDAGDTPPIDRSVLDEMTAGDDKLAAELLADFVSSTRADLVAIDEAIASGDGDQLAREAHRVVGASRMVGANVLGAAAKRLEDHARVGRSSPSDLRALATAITAELDRVET